MRQDTISNIFGTFGAVCWSIQLIPQIVLNYRRHSAAGLSTGFMLLWSLAGVFLGVYNIVSGLSIPLQIQPQILTMLSLITMGQCLYYERHWSLIKTSIIIGLMMVILGSIEYALQVAVWTGLERDITWPKAFVSALATVFLVAGVAEQYIAIFKSRSVEGISFLFCGLDALGDVTSLVSVLFAPQIEVEGVVIYSTELTFWLGIFALGFYYKGIVKCKRLVENLGAILRKQQSEVRVEEIEMHGVQRTSTTSSTSVFSVAQRAERIRERRVEQTSNA